MVAVIPIGLELVIQEALSDEAEFACNHFDIIGVDLDISAVVRKATVNDMPAVAAIFNDAVRNSLAIWQENEVDVAERCAWLAARELAGFPVLVAVGVAGAVLGYASYGDFRAYPGYRYTVEHSVYVSREARGKGIGRALLSALLVYAQDRDVRMMVAAIEAGNVASIRLHEQLGFVHSG